ncbi:MAG TPA: HAMP domain-containing sensor histidine kinase [Micromonosporaceae bacterium]|nr:HAMP domain-containing sensor histidine kinase [Micromonosporaceae bacterium]
MDALPRPLDFVRWIKLKIGILLVLSGLASLIVFWRGIGWVPPLTSLTAIGVALATSQVLAHGMTRPLREMTAAARAMARGDYTRRVRATSRDEVGQLATAFNQMAADLAAADRQRRELIANVSHELRTPIFALQAVLENVADGVEAPDPATLATALAQAERLGNLVTELLDLSRIDAGAAPLHRRPFDVGLLVKEAVREAEVNSTAAGRQVVFTVDADAGTAVADQSRLHQVIANLLDNAARHSPAGGTVTVRARPDGEVLIIDVADEGPGIPVADRDAVFERFTGGADRPGLAYGGGTGLGLAIARWAVQLHGGSIAVVDQDTGCRIRVTLPVMR